MTTDERIEKIERELARVRWFNRTLMACIFVSLGVWFILKTFGPEIVRAGFEEKEIRANSFVLEDKNGRERASLGMHLGGPRLLLTNENGKRAVVAVLPSGSLVTLLDEDGEASATIRLDKDGPSLSMSDENGRVYAGLSVNADKELSMLRLKHENGNNTMVSIQPEGQGLTMFDEDGRPRVGLSLLKEGTGLALNGKDGKLRVSLAEVKDFGTLQLWDNKNNTKIWSAP